MELLTAFKVRRSIRKFKTQDVPEACINDLIQCAGLSPSAKNRQPWHFTVLKAPLKDTVVQMMKDGLTTLNTDESQLLFNSIRYTAKVIAQAPVLILVTRPIDDEWLVSDTLSVGSAIEHICLRATDLGLGTLWIGDVSFIKDKIMQWLHIENRALISAIALGYPDETPKARPRKPLTEILEIQSS